MVNRNAEKKTFLNHLDNTATARTRIIEKQCLRSTGRKENFRVDIDREVRATVQIYWKWRRVFGKTGYLLLSLSKNKGCSELDWTAGGGLQAWVVARQSIFMSTWRPRAALGKCVNAPRYTSFCFKTFQRSERRGTAIEK